MSILLAAWFVRIVAYSSDSTWLEAAALPGVPGAVVVAVVALFYAIATAVAFWPRRRRAKGEFAETAYGEWKDA